THAEGRALNTALAQLDGRVRDGRRLADRLIWAGVGRDADIKVDVPSIGIEFVSAGRRNRRRDYVDKRTEYQEAGLKEYWIIDRFERTLTVVQFRGKKIVERIFREGGTYESPLLPGFRVPLAELLRAADRFARR